MWMRYFWVVGFVLVAGGLAGMYGNPFDPTPSPTPVSPSMSAVPVVSSTSEPFVISAIIEPFSPSGVDFKIPADLDIDQFGTIYILDSALCKVFVFDQSGSLIGEWGSRGERAGQLRSPHRIYVDSIRNVYIADLGSLSVKVYDAAGHFFREIAGKKDGEILFSTISDVAVDGAGNVFVLDGNMSRVVKMDSVGNPVMHWGGVGDEPGQLRSPRSIHIDKTDTVYVCDTFNNRIQSFDRNGIFVSEIPQKENNLPETLLRNPTDLSTDSLGNIHVMCSGLGNVQVYDRFGDLKATLQLSPEEGRSRISPSRVVIAPDGTLYLIDPGKKKVYRSSFGNLQ